MFNHLFASANTNSFGWQKRSRFHPFSMRPPAVQQLATTNATDFFGNRSRARLNCLVTAVCARLLLVSRQLHTSANNELHNLTSYTVTSHQWEHCELRNSVSHMSMGDLSEHSEIHKTPQTPPHNSVRFQRRERDLVLISD